MGLGLELLICVYLFFLFGQCRIRELEIIMVLIADKSKNLWAWPCSELPILPIRSSIRSVAAP